MDPVETLYSALMKTSLLFDDSDARFFQKYRLGKTRYYALVHVHAAPGISLSELSARLLCTKGNATRIMKGLENTGLLVRAADPADNRALRLSLTARGDALLQEVTRAYAAFNAQRFRCLDSAEMQAFQASLEKLNAHLEKMIASPK